MPTHVELHPSLLFLSSRLRQSCMRVHNLDHVSTATGRLRGGAGETCECEECLVMAARSHEGELLMMDMNQWRGALLKRYYTHVMRSGGDVQRVGRQ